jgi:hypothetical protein
MDDTEDGPTPAPTMATRPTTTPKRTRTVIAAVVGVLAIVALTMSAVAVWARATVLSSSRVADLVGDVIAEPDVQAALADRITEEVFSAVDVESIVQPLLPDRLERLAPTISAALYTGVDRAMTAVLGNEDVQSVVTTIVERAHQRALRLLQGDGLFDGVSVEDGVVTINVLPLVARGLTALQSFGLLSDVQVPDLSADGDPAEQRAELSAALGRDLPETFGEVTVIDSARIASAEETVENAQRIMAMAKRGLLLILILTVVLVAATLLIAPRRLRALLVLGLGLATAMVALRAAVDVVVERAPNLADQPGQRAAIQALVGGATTSLARLAGVLLLIGLVIAAIAFLVRRWPLTDLIVVAAFAVAAATLAILPFSWITALVALVLGIAVPIGVRYVSGRRPPSDTPDVEAAPGTTATTAPA